MKTSYPTLQRRPELDALRGFFLVWMTFAHMPTHFSDLVNQPLGFVSSAEGFVFLSAMLVSQVYLRDAMQDVSGVIVKLWRRTLKIYGYHLLMLAFAFTIAAVFAAKTHRPAIYNLINFYLAHPKTAILGGVLLIYCPPLLDILPMYVLFLFLTPIALAVGVRYGWRWVLGGSAALWVAAQFGLREVVHAWIVRVTHLAIPLQETGAFNLFAWQAVWVVGLWFGARSALGDTPHNKVPGWAVGVAAAACLFFIGIRHGWLGPLLTQPALGIQLDKWQLGWLRVINLTTFTVVVYWMRPVLVRMIAIEPFLTLGKASLRVFCAHLFFVFVGLALLYQDVGQDGDGQIEQLHGFTAIALLAVTFTALILVAANEVRKRRKERAEKRLKELTVESSPDTAVPAVR